jgi:hypothetical protein
MAKERKRKGKKSRRCCIASCAGQGSVVFVRLVSSSSLLSLHSSSIIELISRISSHPAVFFSHNKPMNSTFSHNKPAKRTDWMMVTASLQRTNYCIKQGVAISQ